MAEVSVDTTPVEEKLEAVTIEEAAPEEEASAVAGIVNSNRYLTLSWTHEPR